MWEGLDILDHSTPDNAQVDKNRAGYRQWIAERRSKRWQARQDLTLSGGDKPVGIHSPDRADALFIAIWAGRGGRGMWDEDTVAMAVHDEAGAYSDSRGGVPCEW